MTVTTDETNSQSIRTVMSVRIPNRATGDLVTEVERRLAQADGITAVAVEGLRGLEPGLSATVVTVDVTVETTRRADGLSSVDTLAEVTGVEKVEPRPIDV